jgi:HK97 family phage portal protein
MSERPPLQAPSALANLPLPPLKKSEDYLLAYKGIQYSAIKAISNDVASIELKLYKKRIVRGKYDFEEVIEHEALSLLDHVNPFTTRYEFLEATQIFKELSGEAFWLILRDAGGKPIEMWPLRPDWITIHPSKSKVISSYEYRPGGMSESFKFEAEDVIHHKEFNPVRMSRGKAAVNAAAMDIDLDDFSAGYTRNFYFNAAVPNLLIKFKNKIQPEVLDRFIQQWENKFRGVAQSHKIAAISGDVETEHLSTDMDKLGLIEQRRFVRDNILAIFQVPKSILGLSEDVNRANAEATIRAYMERVIDPKMQRLVSTLNEFYLKLWPDEDLFFDYVSPVPEDSELKLKTYENALKYGWMSVNEVRENENLEPVEGGDEIRPWGSNFKPSQDEDGVDDPDKNKKMFVVKKGKKGYITNAHVPGKRINVLRKEIMKRSIKKRVAKLLGIVIKQSEDEIKKELIWRKLIEKTDDWEIKILNVSKKLFEQQRNIVEGKLEGRKAKIDPAKLLFDLATENTKWKAEFEPIIRAILKEQGRDTLRDLGITGDMDITQDNVIEFIEKESGEMISGINQTTLDKLRETLSEGVREGEGIDALKSRVMHVFEVASSVRAEMIARTEVLRASNFATTESYKQSGVVKGKEWLTAMDERTCPVCQPLDGQTVTLGRNFKTELGDVEYPPIHPQCRCTVIPVVFEGKRSAKIKEIKEKRKSVLKKKILKAAHKEATLKIEEAEKQADNIIKKAKKEATIEKEKITKELKELKEKAVKIIYDQEQD